MKNVPTISKFFQDIFRDNYTLGVDWIKMSYQKPSIKLPIICINGKKQCGKTTFIELMKLVFSHSATIDPTQPHRQLLKECHTSPILLADGYNIRDSYILRLMTYLNSNDTVFIGEEDKLQIVRFTSSIVITSNIELTLLEAFDNNILNIVPINPQRRDPELLQNMSKEVPSFIEYLNN